MDIFRLTTGGIFLSSESTLGRILPLFAFSNSTTVKNADFGIALGVGAYAAGNKGTLNGNNGQVGVIGTAYNIEDLLP
jgi:hypothetical protein